MSGKKFRYHKVITDYLLVHELNDLGDEGWELILTNKRTSGTNEYIFKKEIS